MKKLLLLSNACPRTYFEYDWHTYCLANNITITLQPDEHTSCDAVVFISCGINQYKLERSKALISYCSKLFDGKTVIVVGCLPDFLSPKEQKEFPNSQFITKRQSSQLDILCEARTGIDNYFGGGGSVAESYLFEREHFFFCISISSLS